MYPLTVIRIARGHPITVELKSGSVYTGILYKCDLWMNLHIKNAFKDDIYSYPEAYIKGISIKSVRCDKKHLAMQDVLQKRRSK
ncbi:U6 snRNA-associated Sm-like protein LSm4 [Nematocida homosporus]|uniref:U6 snRNA-associated Sm-like protein LSm4 n=1 Tax=Nematocida homosporus TaxID=1912981 RepID=UPI00221EBDC9|nr:U6 snRNA-associated Sm-like protein LSm4 [Nematocida homosporus]KAI5184504.1 U6 snRNA-associated Sm-like protein LSm4 [Nematocida homosporus]